LNNHGNSEASQCASIVLNIEQCMLIFHLTVARLAPNSGLLGGDLVDTAHIGQWIHLVGLEVNTYASFIG
jgi:hypothetical protein